MKFLLLISLSMAILSSSNAFGWGKTGHRIVGEVASKHISTKTKAELKKLINREELAHLANWADFMKSGPKKYNKYRSWHYVNVPDGKTYFESKKNPKGDIVRGMISMENTLRNKEASKEQKIEALKFLIHFVGDIHQPLHAGYRRDKGGNSVKLTWFGKETNLHSIWDEELIALQELSYTEYTSYINHAEKKDIKNWQSALYTDWTQESQDYRKLCYNYKKGKYWEYNYDFQHRATLNNRLLVAGVRLAGLLNRIFERTPLNKKEREMRAKLKPLK
ncbi:MAG: S1/P1 nuclease [Halobacteriovoraceae bacterium]|jgi:hypothetical protein|nr:S1/P1 nuclease [Halobacteriovoraceae bacterium]